MLPVAGGAGVGGAGSGRGWSAVPRRCSVAGGAAPARRSRVAVLRLPVGGAMLAMVWSMSSCSSDEGPRSGRCPSVGR